MKVVDRGSIVISYLMEEGEWKRVCIGCDPQPKDLEIVLPPARRASKSLPKGA